MFRSIARPLMALAMIGCVCFVTWAALREYEVRRARTHLISYDQLPYGSMEECANPAPIQAIPPMAGKIPLRAAFLQQRVEEAAATGASELATRKPLRMIRDPYSAYSAVAV